MQTVTLAEARARLPELIGSLAAEREIAIMHDGRAVATLSPPRPLELERSRPARSILDLPTFPGKPLHEGFDRAEVAKEMFDRDRGEP